MNEAVSSIIAERARDQEGLSRMVTFSMVAHAALLALLVVAPPQFLPRSDADANKVVMNISLGGAPGPVSGGMTPMGGRPVQEAAPPAAKPRPEPVRPPAEKTPAMTLPSATARKTPPRKDVSRAPVDARGRTPTRGAEVRAGSAVAETGVKGTGFGLSTGGGGTGGYLDVGNFCCPEYLATMLDLIRRNWNQQQQVAGETMMKFTILRDGRITDVTVEKPSGYVALDLASQRALLLTRQFPPLPPAFTEPRLTVHLNFQYQR